MTIYDQIRASIGLPPNMKQTESAATIRAAVIKGGNPPPAKPAMKIVAA